MRTPAAAMGTSAFFVVAPGGVAGVVPWLLTGWRVHHPLPGWTAFQVVGWVLLVAGAVVLVHAFVRFVVEGVGTPAPVAPARRLVVGGLYRYVRNPIYLALVAIIVGQALIFGRVVVLLYAAVLWIVFAAFVRLYEEPALRDRFGADYEAYCRAVPAWWPRRR